MSGLGPLQLWWAEAAGPSEKLTIGSVPLDTRGVIIPTLTFLFLQ